MLNAALVVLGLWTMRGAVNARVVHSPVALRGAAVPWLVGMAAVFAANEASQTVLPCVRLRVRIAGGFSLQEAVLWKMGRLPVEVFEVDRTHDLIRRVVEGADSRGPDLASEALGLVQAVPSLAANAVALGLISAWVPVVLIATQAVLLRQFARQGTRTRGFEVEQTRTRRLDLVWRRPAHRPRARRRGAPLRAGGGTGPPLARATGGVHRGKVRCGAAQLGGQHARQRDLRGDHGWHSRGHHAVRCAYRAMPITHSDACRSLNPADADHRIRAKPITF